MSNQAAIARIEAQIEAHYDAPVRSELSPAKGASKAKKADYATRMARWNSELDRLTDALRAVKTEAVAPVAMFPNEIENLAAAERFAYAKQRQLDGVMSSIGRKV